MQFADPTIALVGFLAGIVATWIPLFWRVTGYLVTILHETGHVLAAWSSGRTVHGITVNGDMSGATMSRGRPRGFGSVWTTWWGYPFPAFFGAVLIILALNGWAEAALFGVATLAIVMLVWSRSIHTVWVVTVLVVSLVAVIWQGGPTVGLGAVGFLSAVAIAGSVRQIGALLRVHSGGPRIDDAVRLSQLSRIPARLWSGSWVLCISICTFLAVYSLAEAVDYLDAFS